MVASSAVGLASTITEKALGVGHNPLTLSDGLLKVDKVARQFELNPSAHTVCDLRHSLEKPATFARVQGFPRNSGQGAER